MRTPLMFFSTLCLLVLSISGLRAQTTLFDEDFNTSQVTSITNNGEDTLTEYPATCGKAARGAASEFNSSSVDFKSGQNNTHFLGYNPESPCGGYSNARLDTTFLDLSGQDSLVFSTRYYRSSTLGWGATSLEVTFKNDDTTFTADTASMSTTDNWATHLTPLPDTLASDSVMMFIKIGDGEGVALDDILITGYNTTTAVQAERIDHGISIYPVPVGQRLHVTSETSWEEVDISVINANGRVMARKSGKQTRHMTLNTAQWPSGVYQVHVAPANDPPYSRSVVKP